MYFMGKLYVIQQHYQEINAAGINFASQLSTMSVTEQVVTFAFVTCKSDSWSGNNTSPSHNIHPHRSWQI